MTDTRLLLCNCQNTMALDGKAVAHALGLEEPITVSTELCRSQCDRFEAALEAAREGGQQIRVACTQEAPLFAEIAAEAGADDRVSFTNIRERAGWCSTPDAAGAKIAALLADAAYVAKPTGLTTLTSEGVCLMIGAGQQALDAAEKLAQRMSVTLILTSVDDAMLPRGRAFAVHTGKVTSATGHLGAFEVVVDHFADLLPSARGTPDFTMPRNGFRSNCDVIVDLSGGTPLFSPSARRDGYLRADPGSPLAVAELLFDAVDLIGTFEKPLYVRTDPAICAHSRSEKVGCRNCLDVCPTGAISPTGEHVAIDAAICGGCGSCSAVCPTGAVEYAYPQRGDLVARLQILTATYAVAGGSDPVLLLHDLGEGDELIHALARYGDGLPANVLPIGLHAPFQIGHEILLAALASGFQHVVLLVPPSSAHERPALDGQVELANAIVTGLGLDTARSHVVETADPDALRDAFVAQPTDGIKLPRSAFASSGSKRDLARITVAKLRETLSATGLTVPEVVPLGDASPYGRINVRVDGCTLCLSCVSACPTGAITDHPDRPQIAFTEAACVQCGLCVATCPESVLSLEPRLNVAATAMSPDVLKGEEPFECVSCGKPFGAKSSIEAVMTKLEGHAMFQNADQMRLIQMCDDCRVVSAANSEHNPFEGGERPKIRTTDDYLVASVSPAQRQKKPDDFLS